MKLANIQTTLLELTGTACLPDLAGMNADDWALLDALAFQHWMMPLLHSQQADNPLIPVPIRQGWGQASRVSAMTALSQKAELAETVALLEGAGFAPIALKGAWLGWYAYPAPALRPMTDIDLLLTPETAIAGFEMLLQAGYTLGKAAEMSLEDVIRLEKHMPPLIGPRGTVIELHHRLWEPDGRLDHATPEGNEEAVRGRAVKLAGITYPAATDMLVHLIVHGAYSHRLGCGPRVLADLAMLLDKHAIDWPSFWSRANAEGWREGARLLLHMTAQYHQTAQIVLTPDAGPLPPPRILAAAPGLLLQDSDTIASASVVAATLARGPSALY